MEQVIGIDHLGFAGAIFDVRALQTPALAAERMIRLSGEPLLALRNAIITHCLAHAFALGDRRLAVRNPFGARAIEGPRPGYRIGELLGGQSAATDTSHRRNQRRFGGKPPSPRVCRLILDSGQSILVVWWRDMYGQCLDQR